MSWQILSLAIGPLVGAVIGVITNYIAVKMLFRPYYEKHLGKWRLPFTPGIIPRRQGALAHALGQMVSATLVREEELAQILLSGRFTHFVAERLLAIPSLQAGAQALLGRKYEEKRAALLDGLTDRIIAGLLEMDIGHIIVTQGKAAVMDLSAKNPLVRMFLTDSKIEALSGPVGERVEAFLNGEGRTQLRAALEKEMQELETRRVDTLFGEARAENLIAAACRRLLSPHLTQIAAQFHIAETVEAKVRAMNPRDLEKLVLSVMKRELTAVIWLGGVIGFLLGLVNLLFRI